ncbi:Ubiquitin-like domain-containing CTD phosphatase [Quillaja saponaria]|uniref:Ubiquitin-like domain-containing CTD phosphatase n=1 Tax=Quillaja saponaria TaxID=32244 RepID=A0AAD7M157_QUISA|nr:Ubiquitin-like domain-containing CTD phosphatase [Quillaja saponaria]
MSSTASTSSVSEEELTLIVKWSGKEYTVQVCGDDTIGELKRRICEVTNVLPIRQKLLYPKVGSKLADESLLLAQLPLESSLKMTMIGTTEDDIIVDTVDTPEIVDDFELGQEEAVDIKDKEVNKQKLRRRISQYKLELLNPCRAGKKLLVLDIDYTLFDHRSTAENPLELMRPYLHEFLTSVYSEYDIMIWSATRHLSCIICQSRFILNYEIVMNIMKWINLKMSQLGVLDNPNYKITALLDHIAMITVQSTSQRGL